MIKSIPGIILLVSSFALCAQNTTDKSSPSFPLQLKSLTIEEEQALKSLPELELPAHYLKRALPAVVDNSTQPYMREVFEQTGLCCGQAAGIAYNYTYEINCARGLYSNNNNNLYPTHFAWNWMHGGNGWYGVSYLHSFQMLKHCGTVNVTDYGGSLAYGGETRWLSGYDLYYNGMGNRINEIYQINVGTEEGLEVFKHWINDHLDGSEVGGVGSFYSQYMSVTQQLPYGTPEAGKYVLTSFGGTPNHAQTIVGYNDSIRWDYNNDGKYTNQIDINFDGVVDMKDWEIGGFKMVQSYGGGPSWGNQGYAYMMYKTVADNLGQGGIWNHCVHVLNVKEECQPQATIKVTLTHNSRNKIKVVAGLSNNPASVAPQYIQEFPIFNYQGGYQYMQGGTSISENKTIEFGLDISPLISSAKLNQDVKIFLQVYEYDPDGTGSGMINSFALVDYTNGVNQVTCPQYNVDIANNDITTLSLITQFNFDKVHIVNPTLPPVTAGQPFIHQLVSAGGEPPYIYSMVKDYGEQTLSETFEFVDEQKLYPGNAASGFAMKNLAFDFPFYDSVYSRVAVHVDGYLMFDNQLFPYPYFYDDMVLFSITRHISPFMCHAMQLVSSNNEGMWYEGNEEYATFRWKASIDGSFAGNLNFSVTLYPSGEIDFNYGNITIGNDVLWVAGFSNGNEDEIQFSDFYFDYIPLANTSYQYTRNEHMDHYRVSEDGLITGTIPQGISSEIIKIRVTDNNFVSATEELLVTATNVDEVFNAMLDVDVFPNPFQQDCTIRIDMDEAATVNIWIRDATGRMLAVPAQELSLNPGEHNIKWQTQEADLESGIYFVVVQVNNKKTVRKIIKY